jgi:hypothetical protein
VLVTQRSGVTFISSTMMIVASAFALVSAWFGVGGRYWV